MTRDETKRERLGRRLRSVMIDQGLSTEALAIAMGTRAETVRRHMRGDTTPTIFELQEYARVLGVPVADLLSWASSDSTRHPTGYRVAA